LNQTLTLLTRPQLEKTLRLRRLQIEKRKFDRAVLLKANFYEFFQYFWPHIAAGTLILSPHIKVLCDLLQGIGERVIAKQKPEYPFYVINIPPGTSKSTIISRAFPAWLLTHDQSLMVISSSYSETASVPHAVSSRALLNSPEYVELFGAIDWKKDVNGKTHYETTKHGGRITTSSQGSVTSKHGDIIIPDDPHKPPDTLKAEAGATLTEMVADNSWFFGTLNTRKRNEDICPVVLVMQRLNAGDQTGVILERFPEEVCHICLPATDNYAIKPDHLKSIYVDGYLDPVRKGPAALEKQKVILGSYGFAGQYGQNPTPPEGGHIKKAWFNYCLPAEVPDSVTSSNWLWCPHVPRRSLLFRRQ